MGYFGQVIVKLILGTDWPLRQAGTLSVWGLQKLIASNEQNRNGNPKIIDYRNEALKSDKMLERPNEVIL